MKILASATKIILLILGLTLCLSMGYTVFMNIQNGDVVKSVLDIFKTVIVAVISFYFGQKQATLNKEEQK